MTALSKMTSEAEITKNEEADETYAELADERKHYRVYKALRENS